MFKSKLNFHIRFTAQRLKQLIGVVVVVIVVGMGTYLLMSSHAASYYGSVDANTGTVKSPAVVQSDPNASDGQYVQFGMASTGSTSCTNPAFTTSAQYGIWSSGNYYVYNNMWNVPNPPSTGAGSESLYACSYSNWYVVADMPPAGQPTTDVKTYPNVQENFSAVPVSQFTTLTSTFAESDPHVGDYEDAYDMWLNGIADSTSNEVMIWNENYGQTPAGSDLATVTFGGVTYSAWATSNYSYIAFVAKTDFTSGSVNLLQFYDWLISEGWIKSGSTVNQIDYGVEICSTNNAPATFTFTNFNIDAVY